MIEGIEVDFCPECHGVWLDQGELQHLLRWHKELRPLPQSSGDHPLIEGVIDVTSHAPELVGEAVVALVEFVADAITTPT